MAHNLNETKGKTSFASTQTAWHGLGQIVEGAMTSKQAIELAGLDYEVAKVPVLLEGSNNFNTVVPDKFVTLRKDTNEIFGIVGNRYEIVQNRDAFNFFDSIVGGELAMFETAGAIGKGEKIFITAKMPSFIRIAGTEDITEVYVLLTSTHDGTGAVIAAITPIRVVCANTLNSALKNTISKVSLRHTSSVIKALEDAHRLIGISHAYTEELNECFNFLATKKVSDAKVKSVIELLFPGDKKEDKDDSTRIKNIREAVLKSYEGGVGQEKILGTAWGVYNGITHYLDHEKEYKNEAVKFENIISGGSADLASLALQTLISL